MTKEVAMIPSMEMKTGTTAQGECHSSLMIGMGTQPVRLTSGRISYGHSSQVNSDACGHKTSKVFSFKKDANLAPIHLFFTS